MSVCVYIYAHIHTEFQTNYSKVLSKTRGENNHYKKNIFWTIPILKKDLKNNNEESQKYLEWLCGKKLASQPHSSRFGKCLPLELMDKASGFGQQKPRRSPSYVLNIVKASLWGHPGFRIHKALPL